MDDTQRERIINRHRHSIWMYGHKPQALYWENREVQELRFSVLLECGVQSGDSVLDVGCGFADLYHFMRAQGLETEYSGLDLSPDMVEAANRRSPELNLFAGDLFDFDPPEQCFDWVLLSGALNEPLGDNGEYLRTILPRLFASCRKGLAFNLLNAEYDWAEHQLTTLQPYIPDEVMALLNELTPHTKIRQGYLPVDISYFAWREAPAPLTKENE